jgi:hypothetical protein
MNWCHGCDWELHVNEQTAHNDVQYCNFGCLPGQSVQFRNALFPRRRIQRNSLHPPLSSPPCKRHFPCSLQVKWIITCVSHLTRISLDLHQYWEACSRRSAIRVCFIFYVLTRVSTSIAVSTPLQLISLCKLRYISVTVTILDIIHCPVFYLRQTAVWRLDSFSVFRWNLLNFVQIYG